MDPSALARPLAHQASPAFPHQEAAARAAIIVEPVVAAISAKEAKRSG